ncbi:lipocalin family protein [Lacibacter sediminis]|uniref:Lipocalin family protein n=1 Tax=Lacibacter sediminis TaxID=2760713 RepID=A0A7G5XF84_9BACT|nr:lipocalin family protein [Lacibacter sediminis]QNA44137.1 lipocalin family protein [Lacibacter sediminis]
MRLLFMILVIVAASCKKQTAKPVEENNSFKLLTKKAWILNAVGFDDNTNGIVEAGENQIKDCESDNSYLFHPSGNGTFSDNAKACDIPGDSNFSWSLSGDSVLTISHQKMFVLKLNETEMILQPDLPWLTSKFLLTYRR